jgi:NTE family protein
VRSAKGPKIRLVGSILAMTLLAGCVSGNFNQPDNQAIESVPELIDHGAHYAPGFGEKTLVGFSFSGGGMRAAAFSYGAIKELAAHDSRYRDTRKSLIEDVVFVAGVSGGSVPAAYIALHGAKTIPSFRDNFLYKDPQSSFETSESLFSILSVLGGGLNTKTGFQNWLDEHLFHDATFGDLTRENAPILWINASDVINDAVFTFDAETFAALCSDLEAFKLSEAVAAASAVPGVFSPIVIENFAGQCDYKEPAWVSRVIESPGSSLVIRNKARTFRRYQDRDESRYLKLYDGGVTDNLGLHGFNMTRERNDSPIEPISPKRAVTMENLLFIVVNASAKTGENFYKQIEGPDGIDGIGAVVDTLMATATARTRDDFFQATQILQGDLIAYRCGLSDERLRELIGDEQGWDCEDVQFHILDLSFEEIADQSLRAKLEEIPTAYTLPQEQTDLLIEAASDLLRNDPQFKAFLQRVQ